MGNVAAFLFSGIAWILILTKSRIPGTNEKSIRIIIAVKEGNQNQRKVGKMLTDSYLLLYVFIVCVAPETIKLFTISTACGIFSIKIFSSSWVKRPST